MISALYSKMERAVSFRRGFRSSSICALKCKDSATPTGTFTKCTFRQFLAAGFTVGRSNGKHSFTLSLVYIANSPFPQEYKWHFSLAHVYNDVKSLPSSSMFPPAVSDISIVLPMDTEWRAHDKLWLLDENIQIPQLNSLYHKQPRQWTFARFLGL